MNLNDFQNFICCGVHINYIPKVTKLTQIYSQQELHKNITKHRFYAFLHNRNSKNLHA